MVVAVAAGQPSVERYQWIENASFMTRSWVSFLTQQTEYNLLRGAEDMGVRPQRQASFRVHKAETHEESTSHQQSFVRSPRKGHSIESSFSSRSFPVTKHLRILSYQVLIILNGTQRFFIYIYIFQCFLIFYPTIYPPLSSPLPHSPSMIFRINLQMASYIIYTIHNGISYQDLKKPLQFNNDVLGLTNWILRFPITIYSHDIQEKHTFTPDSVVISGNTALPIDEKWRYFVVTQQDGKRLYCTSQVYYERGTVSNPTRLNSHPSTDIEKQTQEFYLPRCIIIMSAEPYFKIHVNLLKIHRELRKASPNIAHTTNPKTLSNYLKLKAEGRQHEWTNLEALESRKPPSIELVMEYYLGKFNQHKFGEVILFEKSSNWPILHLYKLNPSSLFQFSHFFNIPLSTEVIRVVLLSVLLEKQVIITSKSQNLNVMVIESLLQLIKPLKWEHMLVHNLPFHLIDAANQNFMPFIIGVHKKYLPHLTTADRCVLIVDEDRFTAPEPLPNLLINFENFPNQQINSSTPSHLNEKYVLENSIEFMCKLMDPYLKRYDENYNKNQGFFEEFYEKTSLFARFKDEYERGQAKEFQRLVLMRGPQRIVQIRRRLNQTFHLVQNPRILNNEIAWIEFYLAKTQGATLFEKDRQNHKPCTLKQIKQNITKQPTYINNITRKMNENKERSYSNAQTFNRHSRSGQKLKISMVKNDKFNPMLAELLQQKIGLSLPKNN